MANKFVISDTHFGHTNSWEKFKLATGSPLRPFTSNEEMDDPMNICPLKGKFPGCQEKAREAITNNS
jgi:hypothetical protein